MKKLSFLFYFIVLNSITYGHSWAACRHPCITEHEVYIPEYLRCYEHDPIPLCDTRWVGAEAGDVPRNAVGVRSINGTPLYRCRAVIGTHYSNGNLIPGRGCYVRDFNQVRYFYHYQVLILHS